MYQWREPNRTSTAATGLPDSYTAANSQQIPGGPVSRKDRGPPVSNGSSAGKGRWVGTSI